MLNVFPLIHGSVLLALINANAHGKLYFITRCIPQTENESRLNAVKKNKGSRLKEEVKSLMKSKKMNVDKRIKDKLHKCSSFSTVLINYNRKNLIKKELKKKLNEGKRLLPTTVIDQIRQKSTKSLILINSNSNKKTLPPLIVPLSLRFIPELTFLPFPFFAFTYADLYTTPLFFPRVDNLGMKDEISK
jgi:hypothetical protein